MIKFDGLSTLRLPCFFNLVSSMKNIDGFSFFRISLKLYSLEEIPAAFAPIILILFLFFDTLFLLSDLRFLVTMAFPFGWADFFESFVFSFRILKKIVDLELHGKIYKTHFYNELEICRNWVLHGQICRMAQIRSFLHICMVVGMVGVVGVKNCIAPPYDKSLAARKCRQLILHV